MQQASEDYAGAIESYKQALRNNPADQATRYNLILAMNQLKNQQTEENRNGEQDKEEQQQQQETEQTDTQPQQPEAEPAAAAI